MSQWSLSLHATSATGWPLIDYEESLDTWWLYSSTWVLLSRSGQIINSPAIRGASSIVKTNNIKVPLWTDDFASLFQILR